MSEKITAEQWRTAAKELHLYVQIIHTFPDGVNENLNFWV
jgi:hypothetical protein